MCLVYVEATGALGEISSSLLDGVVARHRRALPEPSSVESSLETEERRPSAWHALVVYSSKGVLGLAALRVIRRFRSAGFRAFVYFTQEQAVERVDDFQWRQQLKLRVAQKVFDRVSRSRTRVQPDHELSNTEDQGVLGSEHSAHSRRIKHAAVPVELQINEDSSGKPISGLGLYLRTDYWAQLRAGGSYGHTCYVARELDRRCDQLICVMASRFKLLDDWGIRQYVVPFPGTGSSETELLNASNFYTDNLRTLVDFLEPSFIYERLVLGNTAGASLSQELKIPYIVEYNGSELLMADTFGRSYERENDFLVAEQAALAQATVVNAISKGVRDQLVALGVQPSKILVNPNGVDCDDFRPPTSEEKRAIRSRFGWDDGHVVVGFTGTYGGWHGIEELAQALPQICRQNANVRFLFLGTGNLKKLIDEAVTKHELENRVVSTGMVPHEDARTLMQAMDITLAPHAKAIGSYGFFGSPTKLFEYMAVGSAIVASELDQIGEVLQPSIRVTDLAEDTDIGQARGLLCTPGSVEELVEGVLALAGDPEVRKQLGANARSAAIAQYSWSAHIDRLLNFISEGDVCSEDTVSSHPSGRYEDSLQVADADKLEAQIQWDNDPCGSHYVDQSADRLKFFSDVESYRYGTYGPWMPKLMEFSEHVGERILEVGAGLGTDLAQFATAGALVTDLELSQGHLALARENFALRGLSGEFVPGDAENMPFSDGEFDVVYSNGVIHHIPDTQRVVEEIHRVLKPGGKAIIMVYRENSVAYWHNVLNAGLRQEKFKSFSMNEIMSRTFELSDSGARPLVKVYSPKQLRYMFRGFSSVKVFRRQLTPGEVPRALKWVPLPLLERAIGWNLIVKAIR